MTTNNINMKRLLTTVLFTAMALSATLAQNVTFKFSDGLYNESLKNAAESNISQLLTNINRAAKTKGAVNIDNIKTEKQAKDAFLQLWNFMPFSCDDAFNVEKCVQTVTGYQVRGIPVTILDTDDYNKDPTRELTIRFASDGVITGVFFSLERHMVNTILNTGTDVTDVRRKEEILNFVERYRSYYDQKDINSIRDVLSDDAIIITGREVQRKSPEGFMVTLPEYKEQNKTEYINELTGIFKRKKSIKVGFSDIKLTRHPVRPNIYLVNLIQDWRSENTYGRVYSDKGSLMLLWEFPQNGGDPRILVHTWQSDKIEPSKRLNMDDFRIP